MAEFASKGVANAGLATGIIGSALGAMNSGLFNGILGNGWGGGARGGCGNYGGFGGYVGDCTPLVNRYEAGLQDEIAKLRSDVALRDANTYGDQKLLELYKYFDGEIKDVRERLCQQGTVNAQIIANLGCMQRSIDALNGLTKLVVPIGNVCPTPMMQYNSWTAPTETGTTPVEGA